MHRIFVPVLAVALGTCILVWFQFRGESYIATYRPDQVPNHVQLLASLRNEATVCPRQATAADMLEATEVMLESSHRMLVLESRLAKLLSVVLIIVGVADVTMLLRLQRSQTSGQRA